MTLPAGLLAGIAIAMTWPILDLDRLWLPLAYEVVATVVLLDRARRRAVRGTAELWAWGYAATGLLVGMAALPADTLTASVVESAEYRVLVGLVFLSAMQTGFEVALARSTALLVAASAVAMLGALMAIAMSQPVNVQAYTLPTAVYLFAIGLLGGLRPMAFLDNMYAHEAVLAAGVLVLVLRKDEQSFDPGGARWGFALLIEGAVMLGVGLLLYERWLSVGGVLSIFGVGIRWLIDTGRELPFWVTLGIAGITLLGLGVLLLFQRDWWDGARSSVARWWRLPLDRASETPQD
ncbi:MAG: hypothetical protein EXR66_09270 [Dehalococcoidia bacterium]|nr:hypothetical protein [Dehalococcoidia bacterium]